MRERDRDRATLQKRRARRDKHPLSKREAREFFRLGKGDARVIAKRASVTEATVKRWKRHGIPEKQKKNVRRALDRSAAAKTAAKFRAGYRARRETIGTHLHGKRRADRMLLESIIESEDSRWIAFHERMRALGFTSKGMRDEWFSPKMT